MRDHKNEDREYLNKFKNKSLEETLTFLSTEAAKLKSLITDILNRAKDKNNEKD